MTKFSLNLLISDKQVLQSVLTFQSQLQDEQSKYTVSQVCLAIINQLFHPSNPQQYLTTLFCDKQCSMQLNGSDNIMEDMVSYLKCSKQQYKQLLTVPPKQNKQNPQHQQTLQQRQEQQVSEKPIQQAAILNEQQQVRTPKDQNVTSAKKQEQITAKKQEYIIEHQNKEKSQDLPTKKPEIQVDNNLPNSNSNQKVYDHSLSTLNNSPTKQQQTKPLRPHNLPPITQPNKAQASPEGSCCQMI